MYECTHVSECDGALSTNFLLFFIRRQKAVTVDPMVFACVAMMSRAIGPKISKEVKDLLEPMLSVGLRYSYMTV